MAQTKLDIIISAQDKASAEINRLSGVMGTLEGRLKAQDAATQKSGLSIDGLTGSVLKANIAFAAISAAASLATNAIGKVFELGGQALASASAYQQNAIAFETMLGSAEKARTLLQDVSTFAAKTPFDLPEVVEGAKRLLAYNVSAEKIIPTFRMLGDIAAGVGRDKLPFLITALGQVQAKTKLSGEELLQFTETGVPLVAELARVTGFSAAQIVGDTARLGISYGQVEEALRSMTSEGGKFYGLMERQSTTFDGTVSNLRDNFNQMAMEIIGVSNDGTIRDGSIFQRLSQAAQTLLDWTNQNRAAIERFGTQLLDSLANVFTQQVLPALQRFGELAAAYLSSPQFQNDLKVWGERAWTIANAFATLVGWASQAIDLTAKLAGAFNKINALNPFNWSNTAGAVGSLIDMLSGKKRAIGGVVGPNEPVTWVGEHGPEPVILPQGSRVIPTSEARSMLSGNKGGPTISIGTVNTYHQADLSAFAEQLAWRMPR